jgi:hypothetical protein
MDTPEELAPALLRPDAPDPGPRTDAAPADPKLETALAIVSTWRDQRLAGGPIARETAAWNQLQAELPVLAAAIAKEL